MEDAAEADGVLEEAIDVEHGVVGAGGGDVVNVRDHLVAHPRCGGDASPPPERSPHPPSLPERMTNRAQLSDGHPARLRLWMAPSQFTLWFPFPFSVQSERPVFLFVLRLSLDSRVVSTLPSSSFCNGKKANTRSIVYF